MVDIPDRDFKTTVLKCSNKWRWGEHQENGGWTTWKYQRDRKLKKKPKIKILELKSTITDMKNVEVIQR